ncbi:MAG: DUF2442 domain-containing protein [Deltaproteobacteria bacterium]|nr:DUF2442 domain-containing protein [Deltaproteobacteria bacterium]
MCASNIALPAMNTRIRSMQLHGAELTVGIDYDDGVHVIVDFKPVIAIGGLGQRLSSPEFFASATVGAGGRSLNWGDVLEFCADGLRARGIVTHRSAP